jgi:hypothetical protein
LGIRSNQLSNQMTLVRAAIDFTDHINAFGLPSGNLLLGNEIVCYEIEVQLSSPRESYQGLYRRLWL